jgi:hypothetical protein
MNKMFAFTVVAAFCLGGALGAFALLARNPDDGVSALSVPRPVWTEVRWPFPIDQWGTGRAFNCKPADCGTDVALYLRAKVGFCNCTTGVADDDDLARVGDDELFGSQAQPVGLGRPISVHGMKGRSRSYVIAGQVASAKSILSVAFNDRCDVIVGTAIVGGDEPVAQEAAVIEFLNSDLVLRWAQSTLGL